MMLQRPDAFAAWCRAVHGHDPFPWQQRLVERLLGGGSWPDRIAVPTGGGKTTVIDVAVFVLARELEQVARGQATRRQVAPLRIVYVVDRRLIVDQAFERARRIQRALDESVDGVVRAVRDALARMGAESPLQVSRLRGGLYREDRWTSGPHQPTVLCSTVDQVGSRLLWRGYGVGRRRRSVEAGLLGHDVLWLLDEAHLSAPFEETLRAVFALRGDAERPLPLPEGAVVALTATQRVAPGEPGGADAPGEGGPDPAEARGGDATGAPADTFGVEAADREHGVLGRRLRARKTIERRTAPKEGEDTFVAAVEGAAREVLAPGRFVLVVVNRVGTARAIFDKLRRRPRGTSAGEAPEVHLLTGRARPAERDRLVEDLWPRIRAGRERRSEGPPLVVVATQCVEVGADLDADVLVTEVCALDALCQRLGRLDRMGDLGGTARCIVVARAEHAAGKDDPVYGRAASETWRWLEERGDDLDGGPVALADAAARAPANVWSPSEAAPVLFPAYVDLWCQTDPPPDPDPDVALFLHGRRAGSADVQLVWRADLERPATGDAPAEPAPEDGDRSLDTLWADTVSHLPPLAAEALAVPLWAARAWLAANARRTDTNPADVEGAETPGRAVGDDAPIRPVLRWCGPGDPDTRILRTAGEIRPGDTLVLPAADGGCDPYGWNPTSKDPVQDLAERAQAAAERPPVLRIHLAVLPDGVPEPFRELAALEEPEIVEDLETRVRDALDAIPESGPGEAPWLDAARRFKAGVRWRCLPHPAGRGLLLVPRDRRFGARARDFTDEDDTSLSANREIALHDHLADVAAVVGTIARALGLPDPLVGDLRLAGAWHDLGKADPRFQAGLRGGDLVAAAREAGRLLAKSPAFLPSSRESREAFRRAGYPRGARHELLSLRLLESAGERLLGRCHDPDLVRHLVAAHHGRCRPFAPCADDPRPLRVRVEADGVPLEASSRTGLDVLGSGVAERFFTLTERYGWWGLSFLEACLRLADWQASARPGAAGGERR